MKDVAILIVAGAWALLVVFLAVVLIQLARLLGSVKQMVDGVSSETVPLIGNLGMTVSTVNAELERADAIVSSVQNVAQNASDLSSVFRATVAGPLVKMAAFGYGLRRGAKKVAGRAGRKGKQGK
ncbi:MAG: DUF948 domain-containing protein [Actinomycetota bacterium]